MKATLRALLLAARPKTLPAAGVPVLVGTAVAYATGGVRPAEALAALLGAAFIQIGTNYANDLFDFLKGADGEGRVGPTRAVQAGLLSPRAMAVAVAVAFGLATLSGAFLVAAAGWPVVAIGVASILSGIGYTGGPYPLAYNGLGDLFVLVFFGLVAVAGTTYVQTLAVPALAAWAALPVGALATAILVVNNVRDREQDARTGKRTLVVRFGRRFGVVEYALCLAVALVVPMALAVDQGEVGLLLPLLTAPEAVRLLRSVEREEGPALNAALAATARLLLAHGALFAVGIVLGAR